MALFACGGAAQVEDLVPDADDFYTTESGLRFQILTSFERGEPDLIALRGVVRGFREALELMPVGSRCYLIDSATVQEGCGS